MTLRRLLRIEAYALLAAIIIGVIAAGQLMLANMGDSATGDLMGDTLTHWTFRHAFIMQTPCWVFWALLFPAIVVLQERLPLEKGSLRRHLLPHIGAGAFMVVAHDAVLIWFMHIIGHGYGPHDRFVVRLVGSFESRLWSEVVIYIALLGLCISAGYYRKYRERQLLASQLETQLARARLDALRMQLNPHFLFNALNSIAMLTRSNDNALAVRMTAGLANLLRYVLDGSATDEVALEQELAFLKQYLEIEKLRFHDRVEIVFDVADETLSALIPNLLLQPLAENAVQHGVGRKTTAGLITIAARRLGDRLVVQITDDGPGLTGPSSRDCVGLRNTRERLEQLYGPQQSLELRNGDHGGVVATVLLPFHTQRPAASGVVVA